MCTFAPMDETRSSSGEPLSHEVIINSTPGAIEPRSLNESDYENKSFSKGKRGVARQRQL